MHLHAMTESVKSDMYANNGICSIAFLVQTTIENERVRGSIRK